MPNQVRNFYFLLETIILTGKASFIKVVHFECTLFKAVFNISMQEVLYLSVENFLIAGRAS